MTFSITKLAATGFAAVILFAGCASIVSKSTYPLSVNTDPAGASISITDKKGKEIFKGTSPSTVKLKSGAGFFARAEYQVKFIMPGYSEKIIPITSKINGWYWGNLLIGGVIGMLIIDPATGAMYRLDTKVLNETLHKQVAMYGETTLKIYTLNEISVNERKDLIRIN